MRTSCHTDLRNVCIPFRPDLNLTPNVLSPTHKSSVSLFILIMHLSLIVKQQLLREPVSLFSQAHVLGLSFLP